MTFKATLVPLKRLFWMLQFEPNALCAYSFLNITSYLAKHADETRGKEENEKIYQTSVWILITVVKHCASSLT